MFHDRLRRIETFLDALERRRRRGRPPRALQTAQDVVDLLEEQVEAVRHESWADTLAKARTLAYLAGQARLAIETGSLAARLERLEQSQEQQAERRR